MTFNVELVNGDLDVVVDKLGEVQKDVRDVVVVDPRERSGIRRSKTPEAGALKTPVRRPRSSEVLEVLVREARGVQRREAA